MGFFETLKNKSAAKKAGLTYEQYLEYLTMAESKGYSLDDYRMHLKAIAVNMTDEQYKEFAADFSEMQPEQFLHFFKARSEGLNVQAHDEYLDKYQSQMSAAQYCDYLTIGKSYMSIAAYTEYLQKNPQSNAEALELYITTQKAQKLNMTVPQFREYTAKYSATLSAEQYLLFCNARTIGLSLEQFMEYWSNYQDQYTLERFYQYCQARKEGLTLDQYDEWKADYSSLSATRFHNLLAARRQNMTLEAYEEHQSALQLGLTVEQYREKKLADSLGIHVKDLPFYKSCQADVERGKTTAIVTSWEEVKIANKLRFKKVVLKVDNFKTLPHRAFTGCDAFCEIVLPWGIQEIGQYAFSNCTALETITIPGSVKSLPRGVFDGCRSLRVIELLSGIEKVDITGWADLPALKTVASAGSIREFEIDKTRNYHKFSRDHWYPNLRMYDYSFDNRKDYNENYAALNRVRNSVEILELEDERYLTSLENFPNLKVLILSTKYFKQFGLNNIKNCPRLHTIIISGADQTDYYTKSGSLRKRVEYKKELYVSAEGLLNQLKFLIVKSDLLRISGGLTQGADGKYRDNVYSRLCWLHVPSETESISIKAPNLTEIGISEKCSLFVDSIRRLLINEYVFDSKDILAVWAVDIPIFDTLLATGEKFDTGKRRDKLLLYRLDRTYSNGKHLECKELVVCEGATKIPKEFFVHGNFEKLSLPVSLETIEPSAFGWCENLKCIELRKVPVRVADDAFYNCKAIEEFTGVSLMEAKIRMNLPHLSLQKVKDVDFAHFSSAIPKSLFAGCAITELAIPAKIKTIEERAFADARTLTSITFSGTMKLIAKDAFEGCTAVTSVVWKKPGLFAIAGKTGFPNVNEIVLPKETQTIPESCFVNWGLREIVIPETVSTIESQAFANCKNLKSIIFQGKPEFIAEDAFDGCTAVETIDWGNCGHFRIAGKTGFPNVKEFVLPEGTQKIPESCFANWCLYNITIPENVAVIESRAFANCKNLKSITFKGKPREIARNAFEGCTAVETIDWGGCRHFGIAGKVGFPNVKKISFPEDTKTISLSSFANWGLDEIIIPESVAVIESRAFANCKNIKSIVFRGSPEQIAQDAFEGCTAVETIDWGDCRHFCIAGNTGFPNIKQFSVPDDVTEIPGSCFKNWGIQDITIPQTVVSIGEKAFEGCPISTINGEKGMLRLTDGCQTAADAFLSGSFQKVILDAEKPKQLVKVAIAVGATKIIVRDTIDINSLNQILAIPGLVSVSCLTTNTTVSSSTVELRKMPKTLRSLELPQCVSKLDFSIFNDCKALKTLTIPDSVEQFSSEENLKNLKLQKIIIPADMYNVTLKEWINQDTRVVLLGEAHPEKYEITAVGEDAHLPKLSKRDRLLIQKLVIPEQCTTIAESAFENLENLRSVEIGAPIQAIGASAFRGCRRLEKITLPGAVISVDARAFEGCERLESVEFPDQLCELGAFALAGSGLKEAHIPDGIKRLQKGVFKGCAQLTTVTGMQNVGYIDEDAFFGSAVVDLVFSEEIFTINNAFKECEALKRIFVPVNIAKFCVDLSECTSMRDLYLPQQIDEFSCETSYSNAITIHARRGSAWRQKVRVQEVDYIKNAEYDELIRIELEKAGLHRSTEPEMQMPATQTVKRQPTGQVSGTPHKRASWNTRSSATTSEEVFTAGPSTVDELLEKLQTNTAEQPYVIESVDCSLFAAPVATSVEKANIYVSEETKVITNNIFSITLKRREKMIPDTLCVVLVDRNGTPVSDLKKVCSIQNSCESIDVQLQLNTGTANGDYYLMVLSQAVSDSDVLCADKCTVDVAFAADVDFGF